MIKGLGAGMLSGGVVGAIVMSGLSLYAPLPQDRIDAAPKLEVTPTQPDTAPQADPEDSVAPAQDDADAVAPTDDATTVASEAAPTTQAAPQTQIETITSEDADTAQADTAQAGAVVAGAVVAEAVEVDADGARVQPSDVATRIVGEEQLEQPVEDLPEAAPTQTASLAVPAPTSAPDKPSLPTISGSSAQAEPASADTPIVLPTPTVPGVVTNRLPSVGGTAAAPAPETAEIEAAPSEDLGALDQFAVAVEGAEGKSLMSFILIDTGEDGVPRGDLTKLAIPVTVALDPVAENAAAIMAEYRAAGIEVVALANDLPIAAGPGDVATALSAYFGVLNQAVALMDPLDARIQSNRSLLQPVLGAIRDTGHGLITYDRGLNTAQQAAQRENIPAATVFRILDGELEKSPRIKRYLDRAAFAAAQDGSVVVVGRSYPDTVQAMVEWALEKKDASIAVVPVSAVMKQVSDLR